MRRTLLALTAASFLSPALALAHSPLQPPDVQKNVDAATRLARQDLAASLFFCEANPTAKVAKQLKDGITQWFAPTKLFDELYFIGNHFVGVFVLKTDDGLILFDSGTSLGDAENYIAPGLKKLGFDAKDIRYIVVTHGHWDHYGGALWFQDHYKTPVGLSARDWQMIETLPRHAREVAGHPIPRRDQVIEDGQVLRVGSTTVDLYITPGHTPGTVSAIFTAHQGGRPHVVSLLGSTAFPDTIEPTDRTGGLELYRRSIVRFSDLSAKAGADVQLNSHLFAIGGNEKIEGRPDGSAGKDFVIGKEAVVRYYKLLDHCMQATEGRILTGAGKPDWGHEKKQ